MCYFAMYYILRLALRKKATIHQETTMLATSKVSYFKVITSC